MKIIGELPVFMPLPTGNGKPYTNKLNTAKPLRMGQIFIDLLDIIG